MEIIAAAVAAAVGSYLVVAYVLRWARKRSVLDVPNARSSHVRPTPLGGGLGIVSTAVLATSLSWVGFSGPSLPRGVCYVVAAVSIAAVSWADDVRPLRARTRFVFHAAGAVIACAALGWWRVVALPGGLSLTLGPAGAVLAFVWCIGLTNAYNFMDGIDGIAGTQAVVAGLGWAAAGALFAAPGAAYLGLMIAAASLGFLIHNWPPARIFMGDAGSAFLGYSFAVLPLFFAGQAPPGLGSKGLFAGALMVWPFLLDSIFTFMRRLKKGENVLAGHRSHLYQRLVACGYRHSTVTLMYGVLAAIGTGLAVAWLCGFPWSGAAAVTVLAVLSASLWLLVHHTESAHPSPRPTPPASRPGASSTGS